MGAYWDARSFGGFKWWGWKWKKIFLVREVSFATWRVSVWRRYVLHSGFFPVAKDAFHGTKRTSVYFLFGLPMEERKKFLEMSCRHVRRVLKRTIYGRHDRRYGFAREEREIWKEGKLLEMSGANGRRYTGVDIQNGRNGRHGIHSSCGVKLLELRPGKRK